MKRQLTLAALVAALACSTPVLADPGANGTGNNGNGNGNKTLTLENGDSFSTPGKMFQDLRSRTDLPAGNPKAIVDAYPNVFDNVGDLIQQKRAATGQ